MPGAVERHIAAAVVSLALLAAGSRDTWSGEKHLPAACPGIPVAVAGASPTERSLACEAASEAVKLLGRCEISLRRTLHIEILDAVRSPFGGQIFGRFDKENEAVFLSAAAGIADFTRGSAYAVIPPADFYRSSIVHEVVHGAMHQNQRRNPSSRAAQEYAAYALQIASLPQHAREAFLRAAARGATQDGNFYLNDMILGFDPAYFAANAYRHFMASRDGCEGIAMLLARDVDFIMAIE